MQQAIDLGADAIAFAEAKDYMRRELNNGRQSLTNPLDKALFDYTDKTVRTAPAVRKAAKKFKLPPQPGLNRHARRKFDAQVRKEANTLEAR